MDVKAGDSTPPAGDRPSGRARGIIFYGSAMLGSILSGTWIVSRFIVWLDAGSPPEGTLTVGNLVVAVGLQMLPIAVAVSVLRIRELRRRRRTTGETDGL